MNNALMLQACINLNIAEPFSIESDGVVWTGIDPDRVYVDMAPLWEEYARLESQEPYKLVEQRRLEAYEQQSDPIFFKWQRGDATEAEWREAVAKVKAENPYPPAP